MSAFGTSGKYEKKPKCVGGCKETESFVAKSGDTFHRCKTCSNLVSQRLKCGHAIKENATSQSEANNGRAYIRCADPGCRQFLAWVGEASSTGSSAAVQSFTYAEKAEVEKLVSVVAVLAERVAQLEAKSEAGWAEQPGAKRARTENKE